MLSLPVKSSLHPDSLPLAPANSFPFCTYKIPRPQLHQNQQLRKPPVSADSKATLSSLDSALTDALALTPAESALTKSGGGIPPGYWSHTVAAAPACGGSLRCYHADSATLRTDN